MTLAPGGVRKEKAEIDEKNVINVKWEIVRMCLRVVYLR